MSNAVRSIPVVLLLSLAWSVPAQVTEGDSAIALELVRRHYSLQNLVDSRGRILVDTLMVQRITNRTASETKESVVWVYSKERGTSLAYLTDERGIPTAYLIRDGSAWIYQEALRLPLKVTLARSVLGQVNLADILGLDVTENFSLSSVRSGDAETLLEFTRTNPSYPFASVELVFDQRSRDLRKIRYRAAGGDVIKEAELSEYRLVGGNHRLPRWEIRNLRMNTDETTAITYVDVRSHRLPDSYFRPNAQAMTQFLKWAKQR